MKFLLWRAKWGISRLLIDRFARWLDEVAAHLRGRYGVDVAKINHLRFLSENKGPRQEAKYELTGGREVESTLFVFDRKKFISFF